MRQLNSKLWGTLVCCGLIAMLTACAKTTDRAEETAKAPAAESPSAADPAAASGVDAKPSAPAAEPAAAKPEESKVEASKPTEPMPAAAPAPDATAVSGPAVATANVAANHVVLGTPDLTTGIPGDGPITNEELTAWLDNPANHVVLEVELPLGLREGASQIKGLDKDPLTRAKIELGRQLYFDKRLSFDSTVACASCHDPSEGYSRHAQFGVGISGQQGGRNSPISYNRILSDLQFWDGRAKSLEDQAVGPIANAIEMGNTHEACAQCLDGIPGYKLQFEKVFGTGPVVIENVGKALAAFERCLVTGPSPYDYQKQLDAFGEVDVESLKEDDPDSYAAYQDALAAVDANPMTESAKRGKALYFSEKANCSACHVGANLTDEQYYNLGVGMDKENPDLGRYDQTKEEKDRGAFKTPTIRNVEFSGPYMHDGSQKTLAEVVEWYAKGGHPNPWLNQRIKKLDLTDQDKADLVSFMQACSGPFPQVNSQRVPK